MRAVIIAFGRALLSQLQWRMLLLTLIPFLLSVAVWGVALWLGLQPMIDWIQSGLAENDGFRIAGGVLGSLGLGAIKTVIVPLIAMWVLLPLMIVTALVFIGALAMPVIVRHVSMRQYPGLEKRNGGTFWGSLWTSSSSLAVFIVLWLVTLPVSSVPPLGFIVQPALWGWLTYRVMAYDALSAHADTLERKAILHLHRWPLLAIGVITGALGTAPALLWLGGVLSVVFFPVLATVSIWLYVLVFTFTGLWFQYYCLAALASYREANLAAATAPQMRM